MLFDSKTGDIFLDIFDSAPTRELEPGEMLIHAGTNADQVFNVIEGTLMATRIGRDGRRQVLSFLFRDHFVGLTATDRYFFSAEAVTHAKVACCSRKVLESRLSQDSVAERAFVSMVFRVLDSSMDLVYSLGQRTAIERLAVFLLYLRNRHMISAGLNDADPRLAVLALPMSRQDIADFLGLKKETVSRSFTQLQKSGLIDRLSKQDVKLLDIDGLRDLAGIQDFASPLRVKPPRG